MRKLGHYLHSLVFPKHFEIEIERERELEEKRGTRERKLGIGGYELN